MFKVIGKFIGILLIIIGAATIIGLFIGMITVGIADVVNIPGLNMYRIVDASNMPIWFVSLLGFFAIGIPFFFLLYLGLKILVNNLKSIGRIAKFSLLGLWLISLILLIVFGVRQATARAYSESVQIEENLPFQDVNDTLRIDIASYDRAYRNKRTVKMGDGSVLSRNDAGEEVIVLDDVEIYLEESKDTLASIEIIKESDGPSFERAEEIATDIVYGYSIEGNVLFLNDFITTARKNKVMDQEVRINLRLPLGTLVEFDHETSYRCWRFHFDNDRNLGGCDLQDFVWKVGPKGELECQGCPDIKQTNTSEKNKISINEDGVDIDIQENGESFTLKINEDGVNLKAKESEREGDHEININSDGVDIDLQGHKDSIDL